MLFYKIWLIFPVTNYLRLESDLMDITNLYAYRIEELAVGMVKAESYEDAREKVKAAYLKHNDCFNSERDFIELEKIVKNDSWFSDNPDVIEIDELI